MVLVVSVLVLKKPVEIQVGPAPTGTVTGVKNVPAEVGFPSKMDRVPSVKFATAKSSKLLFLKSAVATKSGFVPVVTVMIGKFAALAEAVGVCVAVAVAEPTKLEENCAKETGKRSP